MNRLTKIQILNNINERELKLGISGDLGKSWHQKYKNSAWIYVGNLPYDLNEGDILSVFSQYGEIVNVNLVRDWKSGKSKGFCFVCYQDQRSTVLAVDNFNGIKLLGRVIQVDHMEEYKVPKFRENVPEEIRKIWEEGCAPKPINVPIEEIEAEVKREKKEHKKKLKKMDELIKLSKEDISKELKKARKLQKKEAKELKKMMEREKRRREPTPDEERGHADDEGRWDLHKKNLEIEQEMLDDSKFYGQNDHFNFGKKRKEDKEQPKYNIRPDFDKADWRDIEIFKHAREYERATKGEKENLTELIDSITRNEDKDKLLPTLQAVWNNTLPYLKSKSAKNVRSFLASSQLLASMSSFNYMRPIWKKNAMELLWDNSFFKMDIHALKSWLVVIDNLMTNDKTSFKELLARITTSTSTTFSTLITSKEQEYEMRAQYLKRLAFVILSSTRDQYSGQLNEIHERLTENLRLCQAPVIHSQVFTCYRVLLVRMSPHCFVSVWPSMITEMVQILAQIEQHLLTSPSNLAAFDEQQRSARDDQLLQLFLAGCKLLETLCKWTFVSPIGSGNKRIKNNYPPTSTNSNDLFVPYSVRLNQLLNAKYGELSQEDLEIRSISLFNVKTLTSLNELRPFFHALAQQNIEYRHDGIINDDDILQNGGQQLSSFENSLSSHIGEDLTGSLPLRVAIARIEQSLCVDFAEHWQL
uniref:RRM domain-containing protein n=1 Tax=Meloidogyne javanica TaxID=6303 RepID=A0A915MB90_MELJA